MSHVCYAKYISWIILIFSATNVIFLGGKRRAFGSFVASLRKTYPNISLTELNWIGDSYSAFGYMSTSFTTAMIIYAGRKYKLFQFIGSFMVLLSCLTSAVVPNPHWLFLTHTLLHGIGSSLILSTLALVVDEHFSMDHKYRILATTLVSGGSVASILFVIFFAYLIQNYNWRWSFGILGIIYFIITASAVIVLERPKRTELLVEHNQRKDRTKTRIITKRKLPLILLWLLDRILTSVVTYGLLLNLTDYLHQTVKTLTHSTTLTMLFAAGEAITYLIGAILTALTKDLLKGKLKYILLISSLLMAISLIAVEFVRDITWALRLLVFVSGFCLGPSITFLYPAGEEMTTLPGHVAYPISLGGMGFGMMISPLLSAKIAEIFHYRWFFFIQGGLIIVKFLALFLMIILAKLLRKTLKVKCVTVEEESK